MKNLHPKAKVTSKWPTYGRSLSNWNVPEMTFQEYVRLMWQDFESPNDNKWNWGFNE